MQTQLIVFLIFALLIAAFALQNTMPVVVKILFWEANLSLVLVVLGSVAVGAILLFTINIVKQMNANKEIKELKRQILFLTNEKEKLETTLAEYKNIEDRRDAVSSRGPDPIQQNSRDMGAADTKDDARLDVNDLEDLDRMIGNENDAV